MHLNNRKGFSLAEITIVIVIIGSILSIAVNKLSFNKTDNRRVFRDVIITVRQVRNRAKLFSTSYRIAFKIDPKNPTYWVEKSSTPTLLDKDTLQKERDDAKDPFKSKEQKITSPYERDASYAKKDFDLPSGYLIKSVESGPQDLVFTEGLAYMHFFPQGLIEPVALIIQDPKKNIWTLVFNPITGQADIIEGEKSLKDLSRQ